MTKPQPDPAATLEVLPPEPTTGGRLLSIDLSTSINAAYVAARAAADSATDKARDAILSAVQCGDLLTRQKASLPHGAWLPWLADHCPDISAETARRYMRLAKRSQVTDLTDATSLRQAYLATGVLPDAPPREASPPDANAPVITFTRGLDQFRRWYHRRTEEKPLAKWTPEARRLLRNELAWFVKLHDDLAA
ncbi:hypothetical protein ASA1KI_23340 [Opitutales bacterium ASA1]|uniref:DUF3102 domain-containing protein n=1 Tax=Congregicoccus parvus TaxID=3081749 RepID=UPI002B2AFF23|nr:hypothetical protein ASA1KI_23340 [Opitutales bacterium ASA1]